MKMYERLRYFIEAVPSRVMKSCCQQREVKSQVIRKHLQHVVGHVARVLNA